MTKLYISIFDLKTNSLIEELPPYTLKDGASALRKIAELSGGTFESIREQYNFLRIGSVSRVSDGKIFQLNRIKLESVA